MTKRRLVGEREAGRQAAGGPNAVTTRPSNFWPYGGKFQHGHYTRRHTTNRVAIDNASVWSLNREAVEAEIRQRQEKWRQPTTQASPPEPPEEPPPTSF